MSITKDNFIVVYNLNSYDSYEFAVYYANKHNMSIDSSDYSIDSGNTGGIDWEVNGQIVGIGLSDTSEILSSESTFNIQLLNPLEYILQNSSLQNDNIWGIVLGFNTPGGFYNGSNIISSTSRLSRINHSFSQKIKNKLYNRSVFKRFDSDDAEYSVICSRIDAPNLQLAKEFVDNADKLNRQVFANGTFYIDPYSDRAGFGSYEYQEKIIGFKDNVLPSLNIDSWSTTFMDPYIDSVIPFVENDSFIWSWFTDRLSSTFFQYSNALRVFSYNADYDGGLSFRDENSKRWPYLSMEAGYAVSAGAMSNPTILGFLDPNPFFNSLLRGATIGEAYLYSTPYLDWTISLFGDPLTYCSFPASEVVDEDLIGEYSVWDMMSKNLAKVAANLYKKEQELKDVVMEVININLDDPSDTSLDAELALLYPANDLYISGKINTWKSSIKPLVDSLFDFPRLRYYRQSNGILAPNINDYLEENNFKVSSLLANITGSAIIDQSNLLDQGWWQFEFIMPDSYPDAFTNYHFKLDVSDDTSFSNILISKDSYALRNWTYEKEKDNFESISFEGISSSYIGRRIRYESYQDTLVGINDYLERGETYYFRITPYNIETLEEYSSLEYSDIIYS